MRQVCRISGLYGGGKLFALIATALLLGCSTTGNWAKEQQAIFSARDKILPALVNIQPISEEYERGKTEKSTGIGSGVIIDPAGHVVTNYHVAGKARKAYCTLSSHKKVTADLIGGDPLTDVAVLKLNLSELDGEQIQPARLGDSDKLQAGQYVMALGSPLALSRSVSLGIVSTTDRYIADEIRLPTGEKTGSFNNWIQTDAAINPGNSGGPLVTMDGLVVGINSRTVFMAENIGFAIPINVVKEVVEQILAEGVVRRSWIGLEFQAMEELDRKFGLQGRDKKGVLIRTILEDSPAKDAGIKPGDIMLKFNGHEVSAVFEEELPSVVRLIANTPIGAEVPVTVLRDGHELEMKLVTRDMGKVEAENFESEKWGFIAKDITKQVVLERQLSDDKGVLVAGVKTGGPASEAQLTKNDIIRAVDDEAVNTLEQFRNLYERKADLDRVMLSVRRGKSSLYILLKTATTEKGSE